MTTCREVMTKDVQCCLPTDIVKSAAKMMRSEDVGSIPVVQSQRSKKLLGIVTDRDLALKVVAEGVETEAQYAFVKAHGRGNVQTSVAPACPRSRSPR